MKKSLKDVGIQNPETDELRARKLSLFYDKNLNKTLDSGQ